MHYVHHKGVKVAVAVADGVAVAVGVAGADADAVADVNEGAAKRNQLKMFMLIFYHAFFIKNRVNISAYGKNKVRAWLTTQYEKL